MVAPKKTLVSVDGKSVVYTLGSDGVAHKTEVTVGVEQGDQVEILSGLDAGAKVVSVGQCELTDGAKVQEGRKVLTVLLPMPGKPRNNEP